MDSRTIFNLNQKALQMVVEYMPVFSDFDNEKDFVELFYANIKFCQVYFYDRTGENYTGYETNFNFDLDKKEALEQAVNFYTEKLKEAQIKVADDHFTHNYEKDNYLRFARVADDFGIAHFKVFIRNKDEEEEKRRIEMELYADDMEESNCSRCRGGGCPSCDTSGFFTGIKVY